MWNFLRAAQIPLRVAAVVALAYLFYVYLARHTASNHWEATHKESNGLPSPEQRAKFDATYGGTTVKIIQFFARDAVLTEGEETPLCYGVVNAKTVKVEPAVSGIYPAINNCVSIQPEHDTTYTMTAEGNDGKIVTASLSLAVKPDVGNLPKITSFEVVKHSLDFGKNYYTIGFRFVNARQVSIDPPVFSPLDDSAPFGQFVVAPDATTTYTLTVTGAKGRKASKKLTVEVPKG